jgi:hypothetical protein
MKNKIIQKIKEAKKNYKEINIDKVKKRDKKIYEVIVKPEYEYNIPFDYIKITKNNIDKLKKI